MRAKRILVFIALCAAALAASAQGYPSKPIRIVVGFPPGGGNDIVARLVGAKMQEAWGQPVVIDNKPGANSIIATEFVMKSAPDGYTLLVNATGGMSVNPVLYSKLPYHTLRDFVSISMIGMFPMVVVVNPSLPVNSVQELIAYAKANPGKLNYAAGSTAFQVATEMFKQMTGTDIRHIPYKGSVQSINAVMAGDVQMTIVDSPPVLPHVKAKQLRGLAVTSATRADSAPELRTLAEIGALASFGGDPSTGSGFHRRTALWQAERAARPSGPLLRDDEDSPDDARQFRTTREAHRTTQAFLPPMSLPERSSASTSRSTVINILPKRWSE